MKDMNSANYLQMIQQDDSNYPDKYQNSTVNGFI